MAKRNTTAEKKPKSQKGHDNTISPNAAGRILGVTGEAVKQWIYQKKLPAVKISNGYWRLTLKDLEEFIKARHSQQEVRTVVCCGFSADEQSLLKKVVEKLGHAPVVAVGLAEANKCLSTHNPGLYVINLTWRDAWPLVKKIRSHKHVQTSIILYSTKDLEGSDVDRALDLQIQGCLRLPMDKDTLALEVARILQRVG